jgi:hypothetical protein
MKKKQSGFGIIIAKTRGHVLSPHFGQMRRWAVIKMGLEDIRATYCWIGLARGFGLKLPVYLYIMVDYVSV